MKDQFLNRVMRAGIVVALAVFGFAAVPAHSAPSNGPVIILVQPRSVTAGSAQLITIAGSGFLPGAQVTFGGAAIHTTFVTAGVLMASLPASSNPALSAYPGTAAVGVANPKGGTVTYQESITAPYPFVSQLNPPSCTSGQATTISVSGSNFGSGSIVYFNNVALKTSCVSSSQLTAQVPAGLVATSGVVGVEVKGSAGTQSSNVVGFSIVAPTTPAARH